MYRPRKKVEYGVVPASNLLIHSLPTQTFTEYLLQSVVLGPPASEILGKEPSNTFYQALPMTPL